MSEVASIQISVGNINQRQAIAIAIGKGLRDAGFKDISVTIEKCGDPGWNGIKTARAESFLDELKLLNRSVFDLPIAVVMVDPFEEALTDDAVILKF